MSNEKKPENIHIKKFDGGRSTPDELHRKLAFGPNRKCVTCGGPPAIRLKVLVAADEFMRRSPDAAAQIMALNHEGPFLPTIPTKYGPMVLVSDVCACDLCRKDAEIAAARGPSWCIVEIDKMGLSETHKPLIQSAGI